MASSAVFFGVGGAAMLSGALVLTLRPAVKKPLPVLLAPAAAGAGVGLFARF